MEDHEYLGTIISAVGRRKDLQKRIVDCKGVLNEIVEICKTSGVNDVCLMFVTFLIDACFKSKFRHGCEVWDTFLKKEAKDINGLLPKIFKRILKVPGSTPNAAVKHELGIVDLDLEVAMERILLAGKVLQMGDDRISKQLLTSMMEMKVPGFCTALEESLQMLGVGSLQKLELENDKRKAVKKLVVEVQSRRIIEDMLKGSKTDKMLLNYHYDGHMKDYLKTLPFDEARVIFMWRSKMFPTKCNFPDRWSNSKLCNFCCSIDTDEHLLDCCGYMDIHQGKVNPEVFWSIDGNNTDNLRFGAGVLMEIYDRLLAINEDRDINGPVS